MNNRYISLIRIAGIVALILLVPLILTIRDGGVEGVGWNWKPGDFVVMGALLFVTGLAIDVAWRKLTRISHRIIAVAFIILALLAVWAELAVDAVSQLVGFLLGAF